MNRTIFRPLCFAVITFLGALTAANAQESTPTEDKLRDALKAVTLQLRTAESEKAVAMAEKAAADQQNADLTAQVEKMSQQLKALSEEKAAALDKAATNQATLEGQLASRQEELTAYKKSLDKWKAAHMEISDIARKKEAERIKFAAQAADFERNAADLRTKNMELFNVGSEILERYRKYSFGEAIGAREPFTGITKVKLQNLVQDYKDKLLDQTAQPAKP